jgi:Reverse transcriptase (RNA-dependent DNA polymerase)
MKSDAARQFKAQSAASPMQWPPPVDTTAVKEILARGKTAPSPGPDGCEKWLIRHLPPEAMDIVVTLVSYSIRNNHFPEFMKEAIIVTIHKKGDPTILGNHRGIMLTNAILNIALSMQERALQRWAQERTLLPTFQIATKPNVEGRDITSFLALVHSQATRTDEPLYVIQKDQQKGFDYLSLQSFYDAVKFFGMPNSLIEFDKATQSQIPCKVLTPFGMSETFIVSGVNRQGDPRSPIRFTLAMAIGSWYLHEIAEKAEATLGLETSITIETTARRNKAYHTPTDTKAVKVTAVYMMDDTLLLAKSMIVLAYLHEQDERFGAAYGVKTATGPGKSSITIINGNEEETKTKNVQFRILKAIEEKEGEWEERWNLESLPIQQKLEFLKTVINAPDENFYRLQNMISVFTIPRTPRRIPMTLLRKIIHQLLIPKISARLRLQPISRNQAEKLDGCLSKLIHDYYGWTSRIPFNLLATRIDDHGFEFQSIADINAAITIKGLLKDLNHRIEGIRDAAEITHQEWTCAMNECKPVLLRNEEMAKTNKTVDWKLQERNHIPTAWCTAAAYLHDMELAMVRTDQSEITNGGVSTAHAARALKNQPPEHPGAPQTAWDYHRRHTHPWVSR